MDCGIYGAEHIRKTLAAKSSQIPFEGANAILH